MNYWLLLTPFLTAAVGWLIHKFAVSYILKKYWPAKQKQLSEAAGGWAAAHFSFDEIEAKIADPAVLDKAMPSIEKHIDNFLNEKLQQEIPMLSMFVGTKTTDKIKDIFISQLKQLFPKMMTEMSGSFKESFNVKEKISEKLNSPAIQQDMTNKLSAQLKQLPVLGVISGFITGFVSILVFFLAG